MHLPLIFSFWFMVAAYVVHVIDESLLGGSFVEKVREHWWPEYSWGKFFRFNAGYFAIMIASVVAYDLRGGAWLVLPLAWSVDECLFNPSLHSSRAGDWPGNLGPCPDHCGSGYGISGALHPGREGQEALTRGSSMPKPLIHSTPEKPNGRRS